MSDNPTGTLMPPGYDKPDYLLVNRSIDVYYLQGTLCPGVPEPAFMNTLKYTHEYKDRILHINRIEKPEDGE